MRMQIDHLKTTVDFLFQCDGHIFAMNVLCIFVVHDNKFRESVSHISCYKTYPVILLVEVDSNDSLYFI